MMSAATRSSDYVVCGITALFLAHAGTGGYCVGPVSLPRPRALCRSAAQLWYTRPKEQECFPARFVDDHAGATSRVPVEDRRDLSFAARLLPAGMRAILCSWPRLPDSLLFEHNVKHPLA